MTTWSGALATRQSAHESNDMEGLTLAGHAPKSGDFGWSRRCACGTCSQQPPCQKPAAPYQYRRLFLANMRTLRSYSSCLRLPVMSLKLMIPAHAWCRTPAGKWAMTFDAQRGAGPGCLCRHATVRDLITPKRRTLRIPLPCSACLVVDSLLLML